MLKVLENLKAQPITQAEVDRARQNMMKQIELASNDTAVLTVALTEAMAMRRLAPVLRAARPAGKNGCRHRAGSGREIPEAEQPHRGPLHSHRCAGAHRGAVQRRRGRTSRCLQGPRGGGARRSLRCQPGQYRQSHLNASALPNGLRGALLTKKTKGEIVNLTLDMRTGSAEALKGKADAAAFACRPAHARRQRA
ncbi:hypothetical protein LP419_05455 [Massilia sp. H-1]|nr:hypothetical protein LP419_05455 [Massilia sp. H-1]